MTHLSQVDTSIDPGQADYDPSPYEDSTWEIVGDVRAQDEFEPMEVRVFSSEANIVDPMFADFGGVAKAKAAKRWHLPEHLAVETEESIKRKLEAQETASHTFSDEQIDQIRQEAYNKGCEDTIREAAETRSTKLNEMNQRMQQLLQDLGRQLGEALGRIEVQSAQLAVSIAKKIIDDAVEVNPEYIVRIIKEALGLAGGAAIQKVRISPQDFEFVEVLGIAKNIKEYDGSWRFEADDTIRSGCIVETSAGQIDYQLDSAWERIKQNVLKVSR